MATPETPKNMRSDAARNRERLLAAAHQAFAARGPDVPLEDVARIAQVSRTTLYRNFATREELAAKVFEDNVRRIESRARELRDRPDGIVILFEHVMNMVVNDRSLVHVLSGADIAWFNELSNRTAGAFEMLLDAGHAGGCVQAGVCAADFMVALHMAGPLAEIADDEDHSAAWLGRAMLHRALFTSRFER